MKKKADNINFELQKYFGNNVYRVLNGYISLIYVFYKKTKFLVSIIYIDGFILNLKKNCI